MSDREVDIMSNIPPIQLRLLLTSSRVLVAYSILGPPSFILYKGPVNYYRGGWVRGKEGGVTKKYASLLATVIKSNIHIGWVMKKFTMTYDKY